jgi:hypothetical protein
LPSCSASTTVTRHAGARAAASNHEAHHHLTLTALMSAFCSSFAYGLTYRSHAERSGEASSVEDPIMRWLSQLRRRFFASPLPRAPGEFVKSDEDAEEPARTERLLAQPFQLFHSKAGDAHDVLSLFWLSRSTGGRLVGVLYDMACFLVMLSIAVVYGLGDLAERHGAEREQAIAVVSLQLGLSLHVFTFRPSNDRLSVAAQYERLRAAPPPLSAFNSCLTGRMCRTGFRWLVRAVPQCCCYLLYTSPRKSPLSMLRWLPSSCQYCALCTTHSLCRSLCGA